MLLNFQSKKNLGFFPNSDLKFHIIGIGGIGMSAIAQVLYSHGYYVQGSDLNKNANIEKLQSLGIKCMIGEHNENNINGMDIVAYSSAVKKDNPEFAATLAQPDKIILMSRHQILHQIICNSYNVCVSGMHGKTTTSSMISLIFEYAKANFLSIIGGIMQYNQSNTIIHKNFDWSVIEADESDDTFIKIPSMVSIVTNISPEHLDYHLTFDIIKNKFIEFINNVHPLGFAVLCIDDQNVAKIVKQTDHQRIITYSVSNKNANYFANNIKMEIYNDENNEGKIRMSFDIYAQNQFLDKFYINIFGQFNISNCLAAIASSHRLGINLQIIKKALFDFRSTKRRFDILGKFQNKAIIIDDYAHHPREIEVVLDTASEFAKFYKSRLVVVFQPHRYSRLQKLQDDFIQALSSDKITNLIIMPVYSSGEKEIMGINSENLSKQIQNSILHNNFGELKSYLSNYSFEQNDIILFMGAGDISNMAHELNKM
jgi:UDP-N-acetylmuramate--alanine ligase